MPSGAKKESAVKNCDKNGVGKIPEFRIINLTKDYLRVEAEVA